MRQRAFTLIELLVSLSVLLVVIIATARIFGTTGKVAAIGEASADLQATATAVEKAIRGDIQRIARDGVLAIQNVAVRNDVNRFQRPTSPTAIGSTAIVSTAPLLNPTLEPTDFIRCDQIIFFGRGHEASQVFLGTQGGDISASRIGDEYTVTLFDGETLQITPEITSNEFMVRLGHGLQFPSLLVDVNNPDLRPDADTLGNNPATVIPPVPWMWSATPTMTSANFDVGATTKTYMPSQPEARQWVMSRQITLLADDGNTQSRANSTYDTGTAKNVTWFHGLGGGNFYPNSATGIAQYDFQSAGTAPTSMNPPQKETTLSIPHDKMFPNRAILSSRVDTAATSITEYRAFVETGSTSANLAKDFSFDRTNRLFWSDEEGADPSGSLKLGNIHNRIFNSLFGGNIPISSTLGRTNGLWGYPRAEKVAPSMDRRDSKVSIPLLAGNCSSIQIEWTWSNRTAQFETPEGTPLLAQLPVSPFRPTTIYDVPLAGLTTQEWPENQPFKYADDSAISPFNTKITPTASGNSIPWFGLPDSIFPLSQRRGVTRLAGPLIGDKLTPLSTPSYATPIKILQPSAATDPAKTTFTVTDSDIVAVATPPIDCARIEGVNAISNPQDTSSGIKYSVYTYQAIFGPNGDKPYREAKFPGGSERVLRTDYTPWPTALRFTITLHDPKLALSQGRVFQFVVELPKAEK